MATHKSCGNRVPFFPQANCENGSRNNRTTSGCPFRAAYSKAVKPARLFLATSAWFRSKYRRVSACPAAAANMAGVSPLAEKLLICCPACNARRKTGIFPMDAATWMIRSGASRSSSPSKAERRVASWDVKVTNLDRPSWSAPGWVAARRNNCESLRKSCAAWKKWNNFLGAQRESEQSEQFDHLFWIHASHLFLVCCCFMLFHSPLTTLEVKNNTSIPIN